MHVHGLQLHSKRPLTEVFLFPQGKTLPRIPHACCDPTLSFTKAKSWWADFVPYSCQLQNLLALSLAGPLLPVTRVFLLPLVQVCFRAWLRRWAPWAFSLTPFGLQQGYYSTKKSLLLMYKSLIFQLMEIQTCRNQNRVARVGVSLSSLS